MSFLSLFILEKNIIDFQPEKIINKVQNKTKIPHSPHKKYVVNGEIIEQILPNLSSVHLYMYQ